MRLLTFASSLLLIFAIPCENLLVIPGFGTFSRAIGLVVAVLWLATIVMERKIRKPRMFHALAGLFFAWNALSLLWTVDVDTTIARQLTNLQLAAFIFVFWDLYRTPAALNMGLQAYVLGSFLSISSIVTNHGAGAEYSSARYTATGFNPNDISLILALGIPIAWYLALSLRTGKFLQFFKLANYAYVPAALIAIVLTASRGASIATVPAIVFIISTLNRLRLVTRSIICAGLLALVLLIPHYLPKNTFDRLSTISSSFSEKDLGGRVRIWRASTSSFFEHPVLGVGSAAFQTGVRSRSVAHNVYLSVFVELGLVGLAVFALVLGSCFMQAMRQPRLQAQLWTTVLLVWCLGACVLTWEWRKHTWLVFSYVAVSAELYARRERQEDLADLPETPLGGNPTRPRSTQADSRAMPAQTA